jgi:hypothetical protein
LGKLTGQKTYNAFKSSVKLSTKVQRAIHFKKVQKGIGMFEIEENGLITYDRAIFKIPEEAIRRINQIIVK